MQKVIICCCSSDADEAALLRQESAARRALEVAGVDHAAAILLRDTGPGIPSGRLVYRQLNDLVDRDEVAVLAVAELPRLGRHSLALAAKLIEHGRRVVTGDNGELSHQWAWWSLWLASSALPRLPRQFQGHGLLTRLPFGLHWSTPVVVADDAALATVERIVRQFIEGDDSPTTIARQLNREGVPAPRGAIRGWRGWMVRRTLSDGRYIRRVGTHGGGANGQSGKGEESHSHGRVIDAPLWVAAQKKLLATTARR